MNVGTIDVLSLYLMPIEKEGFVPACGVRRQQALAGNRRATLLLEPEYKV